MLYNYIQQSGVVIADTSNIKDEVTQEYLINFGSDLDTKDGTIADILISSDTTARSKTQQVLALFANQINPKIAGGKFLDSIWALTDGERSQATSTTVVATIGGIAGTIIHDGSVAVTTDGYRFILVGSINIPVSGSIQANFASETKGSIPCPVNSLTSIGDGGVLGWETINNSSAGVLGVNIQSDISARADRILTLSKVSKGAVNSIISGLYAITDVNSLIFRKNDASTSEVIHNVTLLPKSLYICIDGGGNEEIAKALEEYKSIGCAYNHGGGINQTVTFTSEDTGQPYTVLFDRPNIIPIKIKITVKVGSSAIDTTEEIKNSILEYVNSEVRNNGFKVGVNISTLELSANVAVDIGSFVSDCQITKVSVDVFQRETIAIEIYEKPFTSETLIEVVLI
tara:strand:- start:17492 stop:18691 length:1200 start_codon:yes stop_codon:yes gene_type:complete